MTKLIKGAQTLYELLQKLSPGEAVTRQALLDATGWTESTLKTYINKKKLARFLYFDQGRFSAIRDGREISVDEFHAEFTQVNPDQLVLKKDETIRSASKVYSLQLLEGTGATSQVWRCISSKEPNETFALKLLDPRPDLLRPTVFQDIRERFRREAENLGKLDHPNVVRIVDHGEYKGRLFIVMEHAACSADQLLKRQEVRINVALEIAISVANALVCMHHSGLVHRDVKPANILKLDRGFVLADFGIVRWKDFSANLIAAATITRADVQLGSWYYMAPEQLKAPHDAEAAADIYALGVSLYELATSTIPSPQEFIAQDIEPITSLPDLTDLVKSMTQYAARSRPKASEVLTKLERLRAGLESSP